MDYTKRLKHHYQPKSGWINDPNGLVYFCGYYHIFYQCAPNHEVPWKEPMCWGHARTKDFINFEELPIALYADMPYDSLGSWSGTAIVKDDTLYLFYASVEKLPEATEVYKDSRKGLSGTSLAAPCAQLHLSLPQRPFLPERALPDCL